MGEDNIGHHPPQSRRPRSLCFLGTMSSHGHTRRTTSLATTTPQHQLAQYDMQNQSIFPRSIGVAGYPQINGNASFSFFQDLNNGSRWPLMPQGLRRMGEMGSGSMRPPGMSGLTFDH